MDFGIMFFFSAEQPGATNKYQLLLDAARFADERNFCSVWVPERHFHKFGGIFPNPSVISAALAVSTRNIQIRAGSLISPLHDPIRIAEEWSVVDNLSNGRAAISFGSGWNINDFVFFPERYATRQKVMYEQVQTLKELWAGGQIVRRNSAGKDVEVKIYPEPVQKELPIWITSSGNVETYVSAGSIGANLLTHLLGQDIDTLAQKIQRYRESLANNNFDPQSRKVSLMLHTFIGDDAEAVKAKIRQPFREYLRSAISLEGKAAAGGGVISGGRKVDPHDIPADRVEELLDAAFERYFDTASLMGTPEKCQRLTWLLQEIGVDEIACLIDFLDDYEAVMSSMNYLAQLRQSFSATSVRNASDDLLNTFLEDLQD